MKAISDKAKIIIFAIAVGVIIIGIPIGKTVLRNYRITCELTAIAKSHGLNDVKIIIGEKMADSSFYDVTVKSSDFEKLTYSQMLSLDFSMYTDYAYVSKYISGSDTYEIFSYTNTIYKNGFMVHSGYYYSDSFFDATKDDNKSGNSYSENNGGSYSFKPYKSADGEDDPYDVNDYTTEEDFYDDHYEDFFDYYDAEDYYKEHKD